MGVFGMSSNNKKTALGRKKQKRGKVVRAAKGKGKFRHLPKVGGIADPELVTPAILRKRKNNKRANITLSGKKKRKIMKQIKYQQKEKPEMEVAETAEDKPTEVRDITMAQPSGSKRSKRKQEKQKNKGSGDNDMDMECAGDNK